MKSLKKTPKLAEIETIIEDIDWGKTGQVCISDCEKITNPKKFCFSHLKVLKSNSGSILHLPFYNRLVTFLSKIK